MLAGYSALNFGHRNPALVAAAERQLGRLTLTSRAFHNDLLGVFGRELAALCGMDMILPMNTGAEAVETALKMARKWGYEVKGVPEGQATIVVMGGNFHGRTTTIVSFSDDPSARDGFGPFTPGFVSVPVRRRRRARRRRSTRTRSPSCSSPSRARAAWSSRLTGTFATSAGCAPSATC